MKFETLICSSDNTHDVLDLVFLKNTGVFHVWPDKIYVGCNKNRENTPFSTLPAPYLGGWREELLCQLSELKKRTTADYVFLLLDDFYFFKPVCFEVIHKHVLYASENNLDYLRLVPLRRSFVISIYMYFSSIGKEYIRIKSIEPYYSSLQPSIWKIDYLVELLKSPCNIWEFEHLSVVNSKHAAVTKNFLFYTHLVEKGKWLPKALNIIDSNFHNMMYRRGIHGYNFFDKPLLTNIKFKIFGYSSLRYRKLFFDK